MGNHSENVASNKHLTFVSIKRDEVPHGRKGKHFDIVSEILEDIGSLRKGQALKVPKSALGDAKLTNVRAALARAAEQAGLSLGTSSDDEFFYVWQEK
jgi:hypothetical protein